uniref:Bacteriophage T5 Orf172 DNA-binding domain-containing protein n=1 Tax=viral metagenome TaxID=1070528 RepID=A0A6C0CA17_9ZZZZ
MISFLKKYSTVPNQFIDDFYSITNENYGSKELIINFDVVVKWLQVTKGNLKRILVHHFVNHIDYEIEKLKKSHKTNKGSTIVELIMITPSCFKELCMISETETAKSVRLYYIALEDLMTRYHYYIENNLRQKIGLLETNQKPKVNIKGGIIYFFEALNVIDDSDDILYKLGKTMNKKNRFNTYNSGNANDIEPIFVLEVKDIKAVEKCIKNLLAKYQYRRHKEIYKIGIDLLKEAFKLCDELVAGFVRYERKYGKAKFEESKKKLKKSKSLIMKIEKKKKCRSKNHY